MISVCIVTVHPRLTHLLRALEGGNKIITHDAKYRRRGTKIQSSKYETGVSRRDDLLENRTAWVPCGHKFKLNSSLNSSDFKLDRPSLSRVRKKIGKITYCTIPRRLDISQEVMPPIFCRSAEIAGNLDDFQR